MDKDNVPVIASDKKLAKVYSDKTKAKNFLTGMKKTWKIFKWEVVEAFTGDETEPKEIDILKLVNTPLMCHGDLDSIIENIQLIEKNSKTILAYKERVELELEEANKEISDIEHAAEFYTLNAFQGYKLYKMLHESRLKRRRCKDSLIKISQLVNSTFKDYMVGNISKQINNMENREYYPRILDELFGDNCKRA